MNYQNRISLSTNKQLFIAVLVLLTLYCLFPQMAHAATGVNKVDDALDKFIAILRGGAIAVATVAILVAAYQMFFGDWDKKKIALLFIGGLLAGAAGEIANWMLG